MLVLIPKSSSITCVDFCSGNFDNQNCIKKYPKKKHWIESKKLEELLLWIFGWQSTPFRLENWTKLPASPWLPNKKSLDQSKEGCIRFYSTICDICSKGKHLFDPCFGHPWCFMDCLNMSFKGSTHSSTPFLRGFGPSQAVSKEQVNSFSCSLSSENSELSSDDPKNLSDYKKRRFSARYPGETKTRKKHKNNILRWRMLH